MLGGCASSKPTPEFTAADFNVQAINEVVVLSVIDGRTNVSNNNKLDRWTKKIVKKILKKKRIDYSFEQAPEFIEAYSSEGLINEDPEMIATLGPEGSRWLLLFVLHDASKKISLGATGEAEMTGYIFDKKTNEIVWRNTEIAKANQGGLLGVAMGGVMKVTAIQMAAGAVLEGLPKKEKQ